jgi:hypothetical protein
MDVLAGSCVALLFLVFGLSGVDQFPSRLPSLYHNLFDDVSNATLGVRSSALKANAKSAHLHTPFKVPEDLRYRIAHTHRSQRLNVAGRGIDWPQHRIR